MVIWVRLPRGTWVMCIYMENNNNNGQWQFLSLLLRNRIRNIRFFKFVIFKKSNISKNSFYKQTTTTTNKKEQHRLTQTNEIWYRWPLFHCKLTRIYALLKFENLHVINVQKSVGNTTAFTVNIGRLKTC